MSIQLTPEQEKMLALWQQHTYAEFVLKDPEAALATMTEEPYVLVVPVGTGGTGKEGVRRFYVEDFIPHVPSSIELVALAQTYGQNRFVEESILRFTHDIAMDWMIPGVPATGRRVEVVMVGIITFEDGKVASERLYWDMATVLSQIGVVDHPAAMGGARSAAKLLELPR